MAKEKVQNDKRNHVAAGKRARNVVTMLQNLFLRNLHARCNTDPRNSLMYINFILMTFSLSSEVFNFKKLTKCNLLFCQFKRGEATLSSNW